MPQKVVIIGAVALGPKAGCRFKRLEPESTVTMVDQNALISYGGCGIPYFIAGDISEPAQLQSTSFNMLRDEKFFRDTKDIQVLTNTRAIAIDRKQKRVAVQHVSTHERRDLPYDKLVLATGSRPKPLPVPGGNLAGVFAVSDLENAVSVKREIAKGKVAKAVVVGAGAVGLEIAQALSDLWGIETAVVEIADQILPDIISPDLARMTQRHMEENDIAFYLREKVARIEGAERVERVVTDQRALDTDLVIAAVGVIPNSDLAREAGLELSSSGAIVVNNRMQSSDPDIYAGGDCVEITNLITGKPGYWPLGSLANRQGRVIGGNLAGQEAEFDGAVGSLIVKLFELSVAGGGMSLEAARREGFDALSAFVVQFDRAHFYPEKDLMYLELVVEKGAGRVLGIQGLGPNGDALLARVGAVTSILKHRPTAADIGNLEFPYAPPFSSAMDIVNALGNTAENILAGKNRVIEAGDFAKWWESREKGETLFLDCREWGNAGPFVEKYSECWKNIPQGELRTRMSEVPGDKKLVLICNTGVRSYEAQITLDQMGRTNSYNLQGGMAALKKWGMFEEF